MAYLFKNATVVTMNSKREILTGAEVLVSEGKIKAVGRVSPQEGEKATVIDASGKLLMPGLINCHCHVPMTLLRNYADDLDLQSWLFKHIFPAEDQLTGEDVYWGSLLGIMEMLASGTTCFADMYFFMDAIASAVADSGIRAQLSRGVTNGGDPAGFDSHAGIVECVEFYKKWNGAAEGRIQGAFAPHALYTCEPDFIRYIRDLAEKYDAPIHTHVDETRVEHEDCLKKYGKTPARHYYDLGLFERKSLAAHCVWITPEDIQLLKEKDVAFVHNPSSNLKLASGIAPVPEARAAGVNVVLGTDGASSNNNLNMFEEINLAAFIHKGTRHDPLAISALEALEMATLGGASALGLTHNVGSVEEGKKADLILLNLEKPHFKPMYNIVSALAYSALGSDVELTMVDGRILYDKGEFPLLDKERIYKGAAAFAERLTGKKA